MRIFLESNIDDSDEYGIEVADQKYTSANTSINSTKLPAIFKLVKFNAGDVNLDFGGGKFDNVAEELAKSDVVNLVYDPYNRSAAHNSNVLKQLRSNGGADSVTCSNVLNVIAEEPARIAAVRNCYNLLKPGHYAYFTVYEGDRSGEGKETKSGYQLNRITRSYVNEIQQVFDNVSVRGKLITAKK